MQKWRKQIKGAHQVLSKILKTKFILRYACRIKNIKNKEKILKFCVCCSWCGRVFTERKTNSLHKEKNNCAGFWIISSNSNSFWVLKGNWEPTENWIQTMYKSIVSLEKKTFLDMKRLRKFASHKFFIRKSLKHNAPVKWDKRRKRNNEI